MAKRIRVDGKVHVFPDEATDSEISAALDSYHGAETKDKSFMDKLNEGADVFNKPVQAIGRALTGAKKIPQEAPLLDKAKLTGINALKILPTVFNPVGVEGGLALKAASNAAQRFGIGALTGMGAHALGGESLPEAAKSGAMEGGIQAAVPAAIENVLAPGLSKLLGQGGRLAKIDPQLYEDVLSRESSGNSIFGKVKELGEEKANVFKRYKEMGASEPSVDTNEIFDNITKKLRENTSSSGYSRYAPEDLENTQELLKKINPSNKEPVRVSDLDVLRENTWKEIPKAKISGRSGYDRTDQLYQELIDNLRSKLPEDLASANKEFSLAKQAQEAFSGLKPEIGGHWGTAAGIGALGGHFISGIPYSHLISAPIALSSPGIQKGIVKTAGAVGRTYKALPKGLLGNYISQQEEQ